MVSSINSKYVVIALAIIASDTVDLNVKVSYIYMFITSVTLIVVYRVVVGLVLLPWWRLSRRGWGR